MQSILQKESQTEESDSPEVTHQQIPHGEGLSYMDFLTKNKKHTIKIKPNHNSTSLQAKPFQ